MAPEIAATIVFESVNERRFPELPRKLARPLEQVYR
jgi:hypothetical protein